MFGFSTENWRRPAQEVSELMGLVEALCRRPTSTGWRAKGVQVRILGRREGLPPDIARDRRPRRGRDGAQRRGFLLQVAFNYGGRADIVDAARALRRRGPAGQARPADLDEAGFERLLSTAGGPPLDLIVRTSGEQRLSNFLLWEAAYAEFVFQDVLWPDYGAEALADAIDEYRRRDRRFGGVGDP